MNTHSIRPPALAALLALAGCGGNSAPAPQPTAVPDNPPAADDGPCSGINRELSDDRRREYAALVAGAVEGGTGAGQVDVAAFMEEGDWSIVQASLPVADPGYFFFRHEDGGMRFVDVWGGMAGADERPGIAEWAKSLGVPERMAACFAASVPAAE